MIRNIFYGFIGFIFTPFIPVALTFITILFIAGGIIDYVSPYKEEVPNYPTDLSNCKVVDLKDTKNNQWIIECGS